MRRLKARPGLTGDHLKLSPFLAQHAEIITSRLDGPIAVIACGAGRNLLPFLNSAQSIDCFDLRAECPDPYITTVAGPRLVPHITDLHSEDFQLPQGKYGLVMLVHFYAPCVLAKIIRALKPGGLLLLETIDDRGGNHHQLPPVGEIFQLITPSIQVISCQANQPAKTPIARSLNCLGKEPPSNSLSRARTLQQHG